MTGTGRATLEFLINQADEEEGLGNAGIETYRDDPYASLAREIGQNSRDAKLNAPVRVRFDLKHVPMADIPAVESLKSAVHCCLAEARKAQPQGADGSSKEVAFFEQAAAVLEEGLIPVLVIADFNTSGLTGPATRGSVFHSLVKGSGVSRKQNDTSGGSFGIGKNAAYAVSDLQAVFYATRYIGEDGSHPFLAQGKVSLMSHTDANGDQRLAEAYWGQQGFQPFDKVEDVPDWLRREEPGTSVCAVGFRNSPDWHMRIAYSLILNFFHAIHHGEMEFSIDDGRIEINRNNLATLFADQGIRNAAEKNGSLEEFLLSAHLYSCLVSEAAVEKILESRELGRVLVRVLVEEDLPKKVCIIRNGMVITYSLSHFGEAFAHFPMYRDFVALVTPLDARGSAFIKRLENPRHDSLSSDRLPSPADRAAAMPIIKRLAKDIRAVIRAETEISFEDEENADEMREYFGHDPARDDSAEPAEQDDPERIIYTVEPRRPVNPRASTAGAGSGGGTGSGSNTGPGPGPGPQPGPNPRPQPDGPSGLGVARPVVLEGVRNVPVGDPKARVVYFTCPETGVATLSVEATGINEAVPLAIISADNAEVKVGRVRRQVAAGERVRILLGFDEAYTGPLEISASIQPGVVA